MSSERGHANLVPAARGDTRALRHGAYSLLRLKPRAEEIAVRLREVAPLYRAEFEPMVETAAMVGAQVERGMAALTEATKPSELRRLDQDVRGWARLWVYCLSVLGLTPASAARLGLELEQAKGAAAAAYLTEKRAREAAAETLIGEGETP